MSNRLAKETSPYLLQHKDNPVDWYPWCREAFDRAKQEDKPIFLSIGYSACHWCHVLAHESFEDEETAGLLNKYFISIKVDKEERPDIDSVYMSICQAFTGSGGWPTSIFMTADQKPFFAGTYFPKTSRGGMIGFRELLFTIHEKWVSQRDVLLRQSDEITRHLNQTQESTGYADIELTHLAVQQFERIYDKKYGGFGRAPKFPTPHILLFLLEYYEHYKTTSCLRMAEHTLLQMYRGGIFDHIGFGFCRYSTDKKFLVPHFEKMLYDNALLILAYCKMHTVAKNDLFLEIAEKTAGYILREMTSPEGGFYSSQDADSEGEEGKYYLFTPQEITEVLGKADGERFNRHFDITDTGNFEGKNIPNLLQSDPSDKNSDSFLPKLDQYRKKRSSLHRDEKILTAWNSLMIAAMCELYLISKKEIYLTAARNADRFIQQYLCEDDTLYVSFHLKKRGVRGFLDDYAAYIFAQLSLYRATLECNYLSRAENLCDKVISDFGDNTGGFYLYGNGHEELILRPKETYDGAIPSGNSLMACNLVRLSLLTDEEKYRTAAEYQLDFLAQNASEFPTNHAMFLKALPEHFNPPAKITVVPDAQTDKSKLSVSLPPDAAIILLPQPTTEYPLKNNKTTYYVCQNHSCLPPTNDPDKLF
ncbi:MAG: thioredoxin domain-containing protein [Ruminococcaceae bacterium]|nr:thioredoxin domain-containing protein [Oscillospiraceae bacterium]